ncbi:Hypothetical predicted protein [Xyrichtys novacula]|uniref:Uncharacterized protein n=1 Tax=Xyrichtys novacula TaxID=13765 RepID=A0AAV1GI65_XYRNO|nr:Hypothetical predicted protein [Xyrichtys novacula]
MLGVLHSLLPPANLNPPSRTLLLHLLVAAALTSHGPPSTLILTLLPHQQVEAGQEEKESLMTLMKAPTKPAIVLKKRSLGTAKKLARQSIFCSSQHAKNYAQTITPFGDHHVHPVQQNTNNQERKRKRARSGNSSQQTDLKSPPTEHNLTLHPSLSQVEDQGQ